MENIKRVLETLKVEQAECRPINEEFGMFVLEISTGIDPSELFVAAEQDGLTYVTSFISDSTATEQHFFQSVATSKTVDELNIKTLKAIGREDLISLVLCPLLERNQQLLETADANDTAALAMLGIAIADHGNNGKPGTGRDPEHWEKISMSMAGQMANMRSELGITLDVNEVHTHLDHYYHLWLKS